MASGFLKNSAADGSLILFAPLAVAAFFPFLHSKLPFEPDIDLGPVCDGVHIPHALTVSPGQNVRTLVQSLDAVKADPLKCSIGTSSMSSVGAPPGARHSHPGRIQQLSSEITGVLRTPDVRARLLEMGAEPTGGSPQEFRQLVLSERARWEPVARAANIKVD